MIKHCKIKVFGRVQGVGFRYYAKVKANKLDLKGFVQNQADGSVYLELEGSSDALADFVKWCKKGSPWSKVKSLEVKQGDLRYFDNFVVEHE
ncbi:acylphosphatase [Candidatus Nomurabacteria bacterium]|nr:acylphosphatase [Candidatus Nomurabacteria bacterium]